MHHQHAVQNNKFSVLVSSYKDSSYTDKDVYYTIDFDVTSSSYHMVVESHPCDSHLPSRSLSSDSCGALIGLASDRCNAYQKMCLWNSLTRERKNMFIRTSIRCRNYAYLFRNGVYYDCKIDDYKLFKLECYEGYDDESCKVWVSRLGSNTWHRIAEMRYDVSRHSDICVTPLNGIIHWIEESKVIFSFDIVEMQTKEIQIPSCYLENESYPFDDMEVGVLGEQLYLSVNAADNIDLCVMKDYGVVDSWTKIFSLLKNEINFGYLWPLHYLNKNCEILLHAYVCVEDEDSDKDVLVSYDLKSGRLVTLDIPCLPKYFSPTTVVGSLVSPNSGTFVGVANISKVA
ncbi:F-box protein CPR1-like [Papaver somniferum]|uniref:F-box protein CPR1-like n=1 Tax=Papaver somniferum TaxID=3469 RepID=UPI000E6FC983|nr:F-box protein CPR1-like [Papaver somniferum]